MYGVIYKITNSNNGKMYIGQTSRCAKRRFAVHMCLSKSNHCYKLKNAVKKHGKQAFSYEIIDSADCLSELNQKEQEWIIS